MERAILPKFYDRGEQVAELAEVLERFNRKERNLLVRSILGHADTPLQLSPAFREVVGSKLGLDGLPADAWWATDYHVSWLAGALAVYLGDERTLQGQSRHNPEINGSRLVEGNQEDIDLLIATGRDLIMVEAKAYGAWANEQIKSKLDRLNLLHAYCDEIAPDRSLRFHLVLTSPRPPQKLSAPAPAWLPDGAKLAWVPLELAQKDVLEVTRCLPDGTSAQDGDHWRVVDRKRTVVEQVQ